MDSAIERIAKQRIFKMSGLFQILRRRGLVVVGTADGLPVVVQSVGFRRRPIYAPLRKRDLRIGNYLYLKLATLVQDGQSVQVLNPDGTLWGTDVLYSARVEAQRLSPAVHVNQ